MDELVNKMNKLLATTFATYLKAHNFHWNVEGDDFPQYHGFFGDIYSELHGSVDTTAEQIRALGGYAKGSLADYKELSTVRDQMTIPSLEEMVATLKRDNDSIIAVLNEVHEAASARKEYGLINYIEGRIDAHKKHGWMLRACMKEEAAVDEQVKTYVLNVAE